jgi:CrcB protein
MIITLICIAGGIGALLRFITDGIVRSQFGRRLPWGTLIINVSGSLLLGMLTALLLRHDLSTQCKLIIGTGFCGGYTTFSTARFETVRLLEEKRFRTALFYSLATLGLSVGVVTTVLLIA